MSCDLYSLFFLKYSLRFFRHCHQDERQPVHLPLSDKHKDSGFDNSTLTDDLLSGLSPKIQDHMISLDIGDNLNSVIALTHKIDRRRQDRERTNYIILRPSLLDHRLMRINLWQLHPLNRQ